MKETFIKTINSEKENPQGVDYEGPQYREILFC